MGHIWLIGMMGSGKTSVSRVLAERLEAPFYDTDTTVEANAGMTIAEIFDRFGESHFRELEATAVLVIASQDDGVVSAGGGVVLNSLNTATMRESGQTVLLDVDADTLVSRIGATSDRPLVSEDPNRRLREIAIARADSYRAAADIVVEASGSIEEVAQRVEAACSGS